MLPRVCVECEQLLRKASEAVNLRSKTVSEIANVVADPRWRPNAEEFALLENQMCACYLEAEAAWGRYRKHIELHEYGFHGSRHQRELGRSRQSFC
jgi:hypothetical protein